MQLLSSFSKVVNIKSDLMTCMIKLKKLPCFSLKKSTVSKKEKNVWNKITKT